ncbi:MAG: GNAT family N-acetyltransferase [Myxococcota bacterium]|nr:GNAT family N-acetyltransferase [Myxococcota bacterium]
MADRRSAESFSEKDFYLSEFRGRTLGIAAETPVLEPGGALAAVLEELEGNGTRVVLFSPDPGPLAELLEGSVLAAAEAQLEGRVWRALRGTPCVGVAVDAATAFPERCCDIAVGLALGKLVWLEPGGGLLAAGGERRSFVDLEELQRLLAGGARDEPPHRRHLLVEIERALRAGLPAVNLCTVAGLEDELFTYAGSGTLFTRQRYVVVRRLGLDDYDAADPLIARGVAEGYLAPRSPDEVDRVLASGFGAFLEGSHLAGIGALLEHPGAGAAEIVSLYTLTRFLGEGIGGHLVRFALDRARERGFAYVFACTTSDRVVSFFERNGFRKAGNEEVPPEKWRDYAPERRSRVCCLRVDLR